MWKTRTLALTSPYTKHYLKWIRYLNVKAKTVNLLGEIIDNLYDFGVSEYFLVWTQKA